MLVLITRAISGTIFASVALICLLDKTVVGIAAAVFVGCAVALNNAIMTRGSLRDTAILVGPTSLIIISIPAVASLLGFRISSSSGLLLAVGGLAYATFIGLLAQTLHREGQRLGETSRELIIERDRAEAATKDVTAERARWRTLFHQSPLPQICLDGSALYARLMAEGSANGLKGERVARIFANAPEINDEIVLTEANEAARKLLYEQRPDGTVSRGKFDDSFLPGLCKGLDELGDDGVISPFSTTITMSDGRVSELDVHYRVLPEADPPWSVILGSFVDQTDFRAAVRASDNANRAKSEFLAVMSHEIRTPLNGVLGMAQAMDRDALSSTQKDRLGVIRRSGEALLAILNDVLDLSKIEAGKLELEIAPFNLEELALGAHRTFTGVANTKGLSFSLTVETAARGWFLGDTARIRQILFNLLSNAVKFTPKGEVRVLIDRRDGDLIIEVADSGVGIAPRQIAGVFERFVQADSSTTRKFGGSGLGLAITRNLCVAMGGDIDVKSELGVGTVFEVRLPLPTTAEPPTEIAAEAPDLSISEDTRGFNILAAEDNPINQLVLKTLIAQFGLTVTVVDDGVQAVAAWRPGYWDLILMDIQMPNLDGPSATLQIREMEAEAGAPRTPIVALTANAMNHQIEAYLRSGMVGIIAKPIDVRELLRVIQAVADSDRHGEVAPDLSSERPSSAQGA